MSFQIYGTGNIGTDPTIRTVKVGDEQKQVIEFNVFFDNPVPQSDGSFNDKGGFWVRVSVWPRKNAGEMASVYQKGQRVSVRGKMVQESWEDTETGESRVGMRITARDVGILPHRVQQVLMKPRNVDGGSADTDESGEIPF